MRDKNPRENTGMMLTFLTFVFGLAGVFYLKELGYMNAHIAMVMLIGCVSFLCWLHLKWIRW